MWRKTQALAKAAEAGAVRCTSAAEAVTGADAVVTMLPAGKHVEGVYTGDVFDAAKADALFLDCSTIDVATARIVCSRRSRSFGEAQEQLYRTIARVPTG